MNISCIVEGQGEVQALPILLKRLHQWRVSTSYPYPTIQTPIRVKRDRFLNKEDDFRKYLNLAANKCGQAGWILILLDADDDCPVTLGASIFQRATQCIPHRPISVVLANREFEAWFIASAQSLNGKNSFIFNHENITDAETPRDAKGWMRDNMSTKSYGETTDQPIFTQIMDLQQAFDRSRSFRKLCSEWDKQITHHRE